MTRNERLKADGNEVEPILFYGVDEDNEFSVFSNFSEHGVYMPHPFTLQPFWYRTVEHRFQAMKATTELIHDAIASQPTPYKAKQAGGRRSRIKGHVLRDGWGNSYGDLCWYVMFEAVLAKAIQNDEMSDALLDSWDHEKDVPRKIYEDSPTDPIWGWRMGDNYSGKNLLGEVLMQVREIIS